MNNDPAALRTKLIEILSLPKGASDDAIIKRVSKLGSRVKELAKQQAIEARIKKLMGQPTNMTYEVARYTVEQQDAASASR
jgi:hypothetical protein